MTCTKCKKRPPKERRKLCHYCTLYERERLRRKRLAGSGEALPPVPALPATPAPVEDAPLDPGERPRTRGDCLDEGSRSLGGKGPCPWVSCKHHLLWDQPSAWARFARSDVRSDVDLKSDEELLALLEEMPATCALDVADLGGTSLCTVARMLQLSRGRVQQIEYSFQRRRRLQRMIEAILPEEREIFSIWDWME